MQKQRIKRGLYAITDSTIKDDNLLLSKTEDILKAGISMLQFRCKQDNFQKKIELAGKLHSLCKLHDAIFIVNDDVDLAQELNADGVHLGKDDSDTEHARLSLPDKIIGISCYNQFENALNAEKQGADYIAFGSFYPSVTKPEAVSASTELLRQARKQLNIPIVAIGGITQENGKELLDKGADLLAVISGLYTSDNSYQAALNFNHLFSQK